MFTRLFALSVLLLALAGCSQTHETTLPNGLRVIVKEDHRSPVVVSQIWYRIGAQDEPDGSTGISHVLEHMMFKGTQKLKPNEFSRIIAEHGGRENAFTGYDYTAYYQQLEKSRLPISFELEAERMRNLTLDPAEFAKEIKVVMEERRLRTDDQPEALAFEKFMSTAYTVHSYKNPVIGWMSDLEKMRAEDLRAWYERWYAPNNATLVVVGDVNPTQVFTLARKYFSPVPRRDLAPPAQTPEPPQAAERRVRISAPAEVPYLLLGWHVPVLTVDDKSNEPYALDVLAGILSGGNSARLASELVRGQKLAANADASYSMISRSPSMLMLDGTPAPGRTIEELELALRAQATRLRDEPVTEDELNRVKAQVVAGNVYSRDSVFGQAMEIGQLVTAGLDWRLKDKFVHRIKAITARDVQTVARKYLVDENLTVAILDPKPGTKARPRSSLGGGHVR
ncbi:MAG: insulinase family protein [Gammaproteobacteria bacterium]|nr:MAG: insulinase family protein [Gammaproteobacteria bacterium]